MSAKKSKEAAPRKFIIKQVPIVQIIESTFNGRIEFDADKLQRLSVSMKEQGQLYPVIIHRYDNNVYEMIEGHRRLRAAMILGWTTILCKVYETTLSREEILKIMRASEALKEMWNEYDNAKQCATALSLYGSMSEAAEKNYLNLTKFRVYATVGNLSDEILGKAIKHNVPFSFVSQIAGTMASSELCASTGIAKNDMVLLMVDKYISGRIPSVGDMNACIRKKFPTANPETIAFWLRSDLGVDALKSMLTNVAEDTQKLIGSVRQSISGYLTRIRANPHLTIEDVDVLKETINELSRELNKIGHKLQTSARRNKNATL